MASSNRHWPSLFKSKPHHQWQHDVTAHHSSLLSPSPGNHKPSSSSTSTYSSSGLTTGEERSPEPKPRWNPRPEQIRILEAIFNSGMVNPPREEIRRIRAQLQEYGQVGDANVFYWFQNRKSRSKNKHRSSSSSSSSSSSARSLSTRATAAPPPPPPPSLPAPPTSSSSSSERSTASDKILPMLSVLAASPNQAYLHTSEFLVEPTAVYLQGSSTQGFYVSSTSAAAVAAAAAGELSGVVPAGLWTELMMGQEMWRSTASTTVGVGVGNNNINNNNNKMQNPNPNPNPNPNGGGSGGASVTATTTPAAAASVAVTDGVHAAPLHEIVHGAGIGGGGDGGGESVAKSMIFINGVAFEVGVGPVNVREAFGEEAVLIHCSGHPVLTDEWGLTLQPLQHEASYYLI